jgi:hypothetical protein
MSVQELFLSAFAGAGKAPVIQMIALGTARSLAISIGPGGLGVKRINRASSCVKRPSQKCLAKVRPQAKRLRGSFFGTPLSPLHAD